MSQLQEKQISVYIKNEMKLTINVENYNSESIIFSRDGVKQLIFVSSLSAIVFPDDNQHYSLDSGNSNDLTSNFLSTLLNENKMISIYMRNTRRKISGTICNFDKVSVTLQHISSNEKQTVFFDAISTISPYIEMKEERADRNYNRLNYRNTRIRSERPEYRNRYEY